MQYRVITNGKEFRIQVRQDETDNHWVNLEVRKNGEWVPMSFDYLEAAKAYIAERMAEQQGEIWKVVE